MKPYLSVIIPMYNEKENLNRGVLEEVFNFLQKQKFSYEVVVSDDGSTDGSKEEVQKVIGKLNGFSLLENKHGGKPAALLSGLYASRGEIVLFSDMDQSTPISEFSKLAPFFEKGYKVVIGSRGLERKNFSLYRKLGSLVFRIFRQALLLRGLSDTQCGFKAFCRADLADVFPRLEFFNAKEKPKGWRVTSYDVELLFLLEKQGCKIAEVPVDWQDRDISTGKGGNAVLKYFRESQEMLLEILRVKLNAMTGKYV
ncbi:MAG: glycosyltransferase [bacterium]|nr:glycosyltransferase [bacterium]